MGSWRPKVLQTPSNALKYLANPMPWSKNTPAEQIKAYNKAYDIAHPERRTHPRARFNSLKASAKSRGLIVSIPFDLFKSFLSHPCFYCGGELAKTGGGLDRIDSTKGYLPDNIRPCCYRCNTAKGRMTDKEFKDWILQVLSHWNRQ